MAGATPSLRLPSQPKNIATAPRPELVSPPGDARRLSSSERLVKVGYQERSPILVLTGLDGEQRHRRAQQTATVRVGLGG